MDNLVSLLMGNPGIENVFIRHLAPLLSFESFVVHKYSASRVAADHQDCLYRQEAQFLPSLRGTIIFEMN